LNLSPGSLQSSSSSQPTPVCLASRITLLRRRGCRNGPRRRLTNIRPADVRRPGPDRSLEAGVVVFVPVLVRGTRMHAPRPLSLARPAIGANRIYVTDLSCITAVRTNVIARVQDINALTGRRLVRGTSTRTWCADMIPAPAGEQEPAALFKLQPRGSPNPGYVQRYLRLTDDVNDQGFINFWSSCLGRPDSVASLGLRTSPTLTMN
jgi:hypothetical protein